LEQENTLPQASGNNVSKDQQKNIDADIVEAFYKYQKTIPKTHLTGESLYDCKNLTEEVILQLSQEFTNKISWKTMPPEKNIREYFDANCAKSVDDNHDIVKLDANIQFMKSGASSFQGMMTEEELKMSSTFPLFRGIFTSDNIKNAW
ncbi:15072_t:CDS:2, partial [Racocetra persica]